MMLVWLRCRLLTLVVALPYDANVPFGSSMYPNGTFAPNKAARIALRNPIRTGRRRLDLGESGGFPFLPVSPHKAPI
jgi:hypothetical protein